jgi:uncharacterized membrane protein
MTEAGPELGKWLAGAAAGAILMYMLDPERGRARRAYTTDKIRDVGHQTGSRLGNAWHGLGSRIGGAVESVAESASHLAEAARPDGGARLAERWGRSAGDTMARAGEAASEAGGRMRQSLAGRGDWAPAARGTAVLGGGILGLYGLLRRSPLGLALGLAGLALLARGAINQPLGGMLRARALGQTIDFEKTIQIDAAPDDVYDMWTNYENFPRFMSHVAEVRDLGRGRSHWVVKGPAGSEYEWDSVLTEQSRPNRLAWHSEAGADLPNSGSVQFEPYRGGTRATVRMSYSPPAGVLGHGIATLLGADPKRQMDDDLARMKALIERGALPQDMARPGRSHGRFLH